jgi:26S proteasome non-ATPase regulatory subunit 10
MWDGDGAWRDAKTLVTLPPVEKKCARLLAAAAVFSQKAKEDSSAQESPLTSEVMRLTRAEGKTSTVDLLHKCVDAAGANVVHVSSRKGDLAGLDCVVQLDSSVIHSGDFRNVAPLSLAAWCGHTHVVDYLLRKGADVNKRDDYGVGALHKAVGHNNLKTVIRIVSDGGCDVNLPIGAIHESVPSAYGAQSKRQTALHVACRRDNEGDSGGGTSNADPRMVAALLRHGADPNAIDVNGQTPLHHAVHACDCATVRLLTRAGASIHVLDARNQTPYDLLRKRDLSDTACNKGLLVDILKTRGAV